MTDKTNKVFENIAKRVNEAEFRGVLKEMPVTDNIVLQEDLRELMQVLGVEEPAGPSRSPHDVFQEFVMPKVKELAANHRCVILEKVMGSVLAWRHILDTGKRIQQLELEVTTHEAILESFRQLEQKLVGALQEIETVFHGQPESYASLEINRIIRETLHP